MATVDGIIEGLQIFKKYGNVDTAAEHDIFYAGPPYGIEVSKEDKNKLDELGWFIDSETDSWATFT